MSKPNLSVVEELPKLKPLAQKRPVVVTKVKCETQLKNSQKVYRCCLCDLCNFTWICAAICASLCLCVRAAIVLCVIANSLLVHL